MRIPTYESNQQIGSASAPQAAQFASAEAFAGSAPQRPQALMRFAEGLGSLGDTLHAQNIQERQQQLDLDLMREVQNWQVETDEQQARIMANQKGADARGAEEEMLAFQEGRLASARERFGHNRYALSYLEKSGGDIALKSVSAMRGYRQQQDNNYRDEVFGNELAFSRAKLTDFNTPPEDRAAARQDLARKWAVLYGNSPDAAASLETLKAYDKSAAAERCQNKLAYLREKDPEAALALLDLAANHAASPSKSGNTLEESAAQPGGTPAEKSAAQPGSEPKISRDPATAEAFELAAALTPQQLALERRETSAALEKARTAQTAAYLKGIAEDTLRALEGMPGTPAAFVTGQDVPAVAQGVPTDGQGIPAAAQGQPAEGQGIPATGQNTPASAQLPPALTQEAALQSALAKLATPAEQEKLGLTPAQAGTVSKMVQTRWNQQRESEKARQRVYEKDLFTQALALTLGDAKGLGSANALAAASSGNASSGAAAAFGSSPANSGPGAVASGAGPASGSDFGTGASLVEAASGTMPAASGSVPGSVPGSVIDPWQAFTLIYEAKLPESTKQAVLSAIAEGRTGKQDDPARVSQLFTTLAKGGELGENELQEAILCGSLTPKTAEVATQLQNILQGPQGALYQSAFTRMAEMTETLAPEAAAKAQSAFIQTLLQSTEGLTPRELVRRLDPGNPENAVEPALRMALYQGGTLYADAGGATSDAGGAMPGAVNPALPGGAPSDAGSELMETGGADSDADSAVSDVDNAVLGAVGATSDALGSQRHAGEDEELPDAEEEDSGRMLRPGDEPFSATSPEMHTPAELPDTVRGGVHGGVKGVNASLSLVHDMADWLRENGVGSNGYAEINLSGEGPLFTWHEGNIPKDKRMQLPNIDAPKTTAGKMVSDVSQFLVGFAGGGRLLSGAKTLSRAGAVAKGALQGALGDFIAFDEHEARLSNLVQSYPSLANPITGFLAANPDDGAALGRFKNVLEGMLLGGLITGGPAAAKKAAESLADGMGRSLSLLREVRGLRGAEQGAEGALPKGAAAQTANIAEEAAEGTLPKSAAVETAEVMEEAAVKTTSHETGVTGLPKANQIIMASDDWKSAKAGDSYHAKRIVDQVWTPQQTEKLGAKLVPGKETVFLSVPSTTGSNKIPEALAERLAGELKGHYVEVKKLYKVEAFEAMKDLPRADRPFASRNYAVLDPDAVAALRGKQVVLTEDVLTTGSSARQFALELRRQGITVNTVAGLMGNARLDAPPQLVSQLQKTLRNADMPIKGRDLADVLSAGEIEVIIERINKTGAAHERAELTKRIQGVLNSRAVGPVEKHPR